MYETIDKYLREVFLARPSQKLSALEEEHGLHEAFMVSRLAMGGAYVGGAGYMTMIDSHVKSQTGKENPKHLVISGVAGKIVFCWLIALRQLFLKKHVQEILFGCRLH